MRTQCDAGKYGSTTGLTTSACTGACPAGYICKAGSTSNAPGDGSDTGVSECGSVAVYCPEGSSVALVTADGTYTTGGTATTRVAVADCPTGYVVLTWLPLLGCVYRQLG